MITENEVIEFTCNYLQSKGYKIEQALNTRQQGIDIIANNSEGVLKIEAKGGTSSKKGTSRYGKGFNRNQVKTHISVALFVISKLITQEKDIGNIKYGFALPYDDKHISIMNDIEHVIKKLGIFVFWVKENGEVIKN
ncbi:MAG: hypothetical protein FH761_08420 [Firmicutes bacterium]|nr:hypothetical protein [Bacillota bacterium]